MATVERIEAGWVPWTPSASGIGIVGDDYVGKHRTGGGVRFFSLRRLFYSARHRRR